MKQSFIPLISLARFAWMTGAAFSCLIFIPHAEAANILPDGEIQKQHLHGKSLFPDTWKCSHCGYENYDGIDTCSVCGQSRYSE